MGHVSMKVRTKMSKLSLLLTYNQPNLTPKPLLNNFKVKTQNLRLCDMFSILMVKNPIRT